MHKINNVKHFTKTWFKKGFQKTKMNLKNLKSDFEVHKFKSWDIFSPNSIALSLAVHLQNNRQINKSLFYYSIMSLL